MKAGSPIFEKSSLYLICQAGGWSLYFLTMLALLFISSTPHQLTVFDVFVNAILCLTGAGLTHLFRIFIREIHWQEQRFDRIILLVAGLNLLMALVSTSCARLLSVLLGSGDFQMYGDIILFFIHYCIVYLFWSGIYFGIAFLRRYRQDEIRHLQQESALREFELRKLRSQMNPHFIFNALNGIRSLVEENPAKAKTAIGCLSNILRNSLLSDRAKTIPFSEEIKTVLDYIELEKIRFEDRLDFGLDLSEDSLSVHVPPMMIQTLAENAVKHGVSARIKGGMLKIMSEVREDRLYISMENSGCLTDEDSGGFGIPNTKQRLGLIYGDKADFRIYQKQGEIVRTDIIIPIQSK